MRAIEQLEPYLQELTQDSISSQLKLAAAWDGLTIETQIKLLSTIYRIPREIINKGLNSPNDYVRYLVAERFCYVFDEAESSKGLLEKISQDNSAIVRFTKFPSGKVRVWKKNEKGNDVLIACPKNFFSLSFEEQILYFSELSVRDAEEITEIIEWGHNNDINEEHLADLVNELFYNFNKDALDTSRSDDGWLEYQYAKNLETLWRFIPRLGETKSASYLAWALPISGELFDNNIIADVIELLPEKISTDLLQRKDFYSYFDLRKKSSTTEDVVGDETKSTIIPKLQNHEKHEKKDKRETIKSLISIGTFLFGLICSFLDAHSWLTVACITGPCIFWIKENITESLDNKIDAIVKRIKGST